MTRGYGQYCGLARALELVGSRWTLLIVRELLAGPRRYTELAQGLPGIPSNILSSRLREMEDGGIVERALEPRPSTSVVYALTAYGQELEGPMTALGLWGVKSLAPPTSDDTYSTSALALALKSMFNAEQAGSRDLLADIQLGDQHLYVLVDNGQVCVPRQPPAEPDLTLTASPAVFSGLFAGHLDIDAAVETGAATVDGSRRDAAPVLQDLPHATAGPRPWRRHVTSQVHDDHLDFLRLHPGTRRFHRRSHLRHLVVGVPLTDCDGFGSVVCSAFPGTVVRADDTMVDAEPVHLVRDLARVLRNAVRPRGWPEPWLMCGNHVIVRHHVHADVHALHAHLRQGSVTVQLGDEVGADAPLGEVGHTGNSTAPHLHFQLMSTADPTTAEPIPCAFRRYERLVGDEWMPGRRRCSVRQSAKARRAAVS